MPYQREAEIVLAMWRQVDQKLQSATDETAERELLEDDAVRLRAEYRRLTDLARENNRPVPPPMTRS